MNIEILSEKEEKGVYLKVTIEGFEPFWFYRQGASKIETQLLHEKLRSLFGQQMRQVRTVSYLRGWRDAKAKRVKQDKDWNPVSVDLMNWEKKEAGL